MTDMQFRSDFTVNLLDHMGSDATICQAARVSTLGGDSLDTGEAEGLIRYLMAHRHGSPFEHGSLTFYIEAPIFVWREFMRHRIGFSYNETSARYRDLEPVFYIPPRGRGLVRGESAARPVFEAGDTGQRLDVKAYSTRAYEVAWDSYRSMREAGIASEVARSVLPVGIYSSAFVTCNPRSLMAFLSLRTHDSGATFTSYPQWEIEQVAEGMEVALHDHWPITWRQFCEQGRVAP